MKDKKYIIPLAIGALLLITGAVMLTKKIISNNAAK